MDTVKKVTRKVVKKDSETDLIDCEILKNCSYGRKGETAEIERQYVRVMQQNNAVRVIV